MFKFKKIASVLASAVMVSSTIALAAAASYPAPFVQNGQADVAVVYGSSATMGVTDVIEASNIQSDLLDKLLSQIVSATGGTTTGPTIVGKAVSLASGSDLLYLNDDLGENIQILTKDDLPTILADGTFTDDEGEDYDYEQILVISQSSTNHVAFSNSDNDLDDPTILIELSTSATDPIYNLTVTFDGAVPFNATASEGETITFFGKTYTIGTATDSDTLVLLGGSASATIEVGETKTMTAGDKSYEVTLTGISTSDTSPKALISVNGNTAQFTEGQTKKVAGIDVFVKTVFKTGDNAGHVEIQLGADQLKFEDGSAVVRGSGSTETDIDGTKVYIDGGVYAMRKLVVSVAAEDSDKNHIEVGKSFTDPVFGTIKLEFVGMHNAPEISGHDDVSTTRNKLQIRKGGDRELLLSATDAAGNTQTIPFTYQNALADDNNEPIHVVEGVNMTEDDYFILNSGNYQHFMQLTKVDADESGQVTFKDLFTGTSYGTDSGTNHNNNQTVYISGQAYTIERVTNSIVKIYSSDFSTNQAVFPYIKLVNGEDHRFALTDNVAIDERLTASGTNSDESKIYELPTGTLQFKYTNDSATFSYRIDSGSWTSTSTADAIYQIGAVDYYVDTTFTVNVSLVINNISLGKEQNGSTDTPRTDPAILFVEDEDKSESVTTTKNAVVLPTSDDGRYSTVGTPKFTGTYDSETFDDTDFEGYLTNFGTYVLKDSSDEHQTFAYLTYPKSMMYFDVYFAEEGATITGSGTTTPSGEAGNVHLILDREADSYRGKNLIVVGGSCVNTLAATLLGSSTPLCGQDFTDATGVGAGEYLIQTFEREEGKIATLVAGYNAGDTINAATAFRTQSGILIEAGKKYKGTTASNAVPVTTESTTGGSS